MNDGDWVESCSALVEHYDGRWEIVYWTKEQDDVDIDTTGSSRKQSKRHSGPSDFGISDSAGLRTSKNNNDQLVEV
jgi:hypothetical protein